MTYQTVETRQLFEEMSPAQSDSIWTAVDGKMEDLLSAVRDLPIYADRPLAPDRGIEASLRALPFLIKSDLRRNFPHNFLRPGTAFAQMIASKQAEIVRTSGTSSDRLQVFWETDWWERQELAALRRHPAIRPFLNGPYNEVVLTTPMCAESVCKTGPATMEERRVDNLLFLNTQHDPSRWTPADLSRMADEIDQFRPVAIEADPVYLSILARHLRDTNRPFPRIDWILLTYEFVSALDKSLIHSLFDCPVYDYYGLTEAGVFFLECPNHRHHFCGSDCAIELIRPKNSPLPVEIAEVVVTTWGNKAEPLLRYRTGDLVTLDSGQCACGMPGPAVRCFEGRIRDLIQFPDGEVYTPRQIDIALYGTQGLAQYKCVQEQPNAVRIEYVQDGRTDPGDEIHHRIRRFWPAVRVTVKRLPYLTPESSGKYRTAVPL